MESFHALSPWNQGIPLSQHINVFNQEGLLSFSVQSFYWGLIM